MPEESGKRKLTLYVNEDVIEKAKKLDLNISEITEGVLRSYAFKPDELEKASLVEAYKTLFDSMVPTLRDFMTSVDVGEIESNPWNNLPEKIVITLTQSGRFWYSVADDYNDFDDLPLWDLYEPTRILSNFINALSEAAEKRNERISELKIAKGIIDAIAGSVKPSSVSAEKT